MFVRFIADWAQYQGGEVRDFDKQYADQLIADGKAVYAGSRDQNSLSYDPVSGALVDGAGNQTMRSGRPRSATLKKAWFGRVQSVVNGADHTSSYMTTLECHADRYRIWVINPLAVPLTNVRVSIGTSDTLPAELASLHGSSSAPGTNLSNGALGTSAAFTVAAGTDVDAISATPSPWIDGYTIDRADGGTLPLIRVRVEIPAAGNPNRPAVNTGSGTGIGWENPVDSAGRVMKARIGTGLGCTTPSAASSTAWSDIPVPIIIEYQPRFGTGTTVMVLGDSIEEGYGPTITGYNFVQKARAAISSMLRPVEVCNMAMGGADASSIATRAEAAIPLLLPDVVISPLFTPNGITPPTTSASVLGQMGRGLGRVRAAASTAKAEYIGFSGIPMLAVAPDSTSASEDYDAATVARFNTYIASVLATGDSVIDGYTAVAGTPDADGQATFRSGASVDGLHLSEAGDNLVTIAAIPVLRGVIY